MTGPVLMTLIRGGWVILVFQFLTAPWLVAQNASRVRVVGNLEPHQMIERVLEGRADR